jgi:hypothetical protein
MLKAEWKSNKWVEETPKKKAIEMIAFFHMINLALE